MRRSLFSALLVAFILSFISSEVMGAKRVGFIESVRMAIHNNDEIRAADQDIEISKSKSKEAHPRGIPVIKYEHRIAPVPKDMDNARDSFFGGDISVFNSFKVELGAPITTFGKIKTAQELAELGIDASWFKRGKKSMILS